MQISEQLKDCISEKLKEENFTNLTTCTRIQEQTPYRAEISRAVSLYWGESRCVAVLLSHVKPEQEMFSGIDVVKGVFETSTMLCIRSRYIAS